MPTHDTNGHARPAGVVRWAVPAVAMLAGAGYIVAGLVGDNVGFGVFGLALMVSAAIGFVLLTRVSETAAGLANRNDERINSIDRDASLFAGMVLLGVVLAMFMVEIARGHEGSPYYQLAAVSGIGYLAAFAWLRVTR